VPEIARAWLGELPPPRVARLAALKDAHGAVIDRALLLYFEAPHSFTGEHVLEIHAHGAPVVLDALRRRVCAFGARPARAGEFSERAFLNGKLDLAQAEAIADLIASRSEAQARAALRSLQGEFSSRVRALLRTLVEVRAHVEAAIDFPEEEIDFLADPALRARLDDLRKQLSMLLAEARRGVRLTDGLHVAIVGRPNVGKSTIINRLLGEERMLTGPEAGITRDAIATTWRWRDRDIKLVDTAGMRRRANVFEKLEKLSVADTLRAIQYAEVVVLVLDGEQMLEKQDLTFARLVEDEGRGLVIAVNKWDKIDQPQKALRKLEDRLEASLAQMRGVPVVVFSALTGKGLDKLMPTVMRVHASWNKRIGTGELNRWLAPVLEEHPPPLNKGRRIKIRYMTQAKARPPTFAVFASQPTALPESYQRYLVNAIRQRFKLEGVPIRVTVRGGKNPFDTERD
jgi:tRNA modification GTPase TrmE